MKHKFWVQYWEEINDIATDSIDEIFADSEDEALAIAKRKYKLGRKFEIIE